MQERAEAQYPGGDTVLTDYTYRVLKLSDLSHYCFLSYFFLDTSKTKHTVLVNSIQLGRSKTES